MAQKTKGPGIQSAAGLIRYYDTDEDTNIKVRPSFVLILAGVIGVAALAVRYFYAY